MAAADRMVGPVPRVLRLPKVADVEWGGVGFGRRTDLDLVEGRIQLLGHELREAGGDALAELHLAGHQGDAAVLANLQVGVNRLRHVLGVGPGAGARRGRRQRGELKHGHLLGAGAG